MPTVKPFAARTGAVLLANLPSLHTRRRRSTTTVASWARCAGGVVALIVGGGVIEAAETVLAIVLGIFLVVGALGAFILEATSDHRG